MLPGLERWELGYLAVRNRQFVYLLGIYDSLCARHWPTVASTVEGQGEVEVDWRDRRTKLLR